MVQLLAILFYMIQRAEFLLKTPDTQENLYLQRWKRDDWPSDATIIITHGVAEHSDCYNHTAEALANQRLQVFAWDLPGHGKSYGQRGYIQSFKEFADRLNFVLQEVKKLITDDNPVYLFGHSLGGLITLKFILEYPNAPVKALLLSSPALGVAVEIPRYKDRAARVLNVIAPKFTIPHELNFEDLSRDRTIIANYPKDPLRHKKYSAPLYLGILETMQEVHSRAHHIEIPIYIQAAGQDKIVSTVDTQEFFRRLSSTDKKLKIYENSYHEIFNDLNRQEVVDDLIGYLRQ